MTKALAAAVAAIALVVGLAAPAGADLPGPAGPLRREGDHVVDEDGRVVLLRGVNVVWKAAPFVPPDVPGGLTDVDLDRIAGHGFDVVRLGVSFDGLMPAKGEVDEAYLEAVASVVDRIAARGMWVLLDVHQDLMGDPWGNGFPAWAIQHTSALEALEPDLGFPLNAARPSHNVAWDAFWADAVLAPGDPKGVVGYLTDAVGALADRLASHPGLAGIEILNEVWAGTPFATCAATYAVGCPVVDAYVQRTWQRLTDRIREADPDVLVWWEPPSVWNFTVPSSFGLPPITPAITDPQVGFAFHDYCAFGELSTYLGLPSALQIGCDAYHDLTWVNAARMRDRTRLPQLVTEFGNIDDGVELERSLQRSDATFTGWQYWHYGAGFSLRAASTEPFSPTQLAHLVRTYPVATAGTPLELTFDPASGAARYRYAPEDLGVPTVLALSDVHSTTGWTVTVDGGAVVPGSQHDGRVEVSADPGATEVTVTVQRATAPTAPPVPSPADDGDSGRRLPATGGAPPMALGSALALLALALRRVVRTAGATDDPGSAAPSAPTNPPRGDRR